jgi:hypothetical protein
MGKTLSSRNEYTALEKIDSITQVVFNAISSPGMTPAQDMDGAIQQLRIALMMLLDQFSISCLKQSILTDELMLLQITALRLREENEQAGEVLGGLLRVPDDNELVSDSVSLLRSEGDALFDTDDGTLIFENETALKHAFRCAIEYYNNELTTKILNA